MQQCYHDISNFVSCTYKFVYNSLTYTKKCMDLFVAYLKSHHICPCKCAHCFLFKATDTNVRTNYVPDTSNESTIQYKDIKGTNYQLVTCLQFSLYD